MCVCVHGTALEEIDLTLCFSSAFYTLYMTFFPCWKQRESVPAAETSGSNRQEREHGQEECIFFLMVTGLIRVSSRAAELWGLAPRTRQSKSPVQQVEAASPLICPYFSPSFRILSSPTAFFPPAYIQFAPFDDPNLDCDFFRVFVGDVEPEGH